MQSGAISIHRAYKNAKKIAQLTPLDYLRRYWRQVDPEDRVRFLIEMLTPAERRALSLGRMPRRRTPMPDTPVPLHDATASSRTAAHDSVIRLALLCMAMDPTSPLTEPQRQRILALDQRTTPLTPHERAALRGPLLAWVGTRMPRVVDIVAAQFTGDDA